jgi:predicted nucleic acid-binding protein
LIVTGDSDLLELGGFEGIEIIQVAEFLNRIGDPEQP